MRLCIATPLYPPESGGPATYARALEVGLPHCGTEVSVVKFTEVLQYKKFIRHILYFWNVFRSAQDASIVLALDPVSVGLPALLAARLARTPFVVKIVGDYAWEQGRQRFKIWLPLEEFVRTKEVPLPVLLLRTVQTYVASRADHIIVPSEYLKNIVIAWGMPSDKITVLVNANPSDEIGTVPEVVAPLSRPRIVSVGRLVPWKGVDGVITAMLRVRERFPEAQLIIVGDGPERATLERYAHVRLKDGYTFTGALPQASALAVVQSADVFVLNSTYEGLSHILLEALQLGKAIIATKAGGNPEVIKDGKNGLLVSVGDAKGLADACIAVLSDTRIRQNLEINAAASSDRYTPERMILATNALLSSLL